MAENKYLDRKIMGKFEKWKFRPEIFAIKGPRQAGKTTLLYMFKENLISQNIHSQDITFITFEDRQILQDFSKDPVNYIKTYVKSLEPENQHYFFIDEFQYLKNGGQKLKLLFDLSKNIKFIITGSSSLEIADELSKFLVGRVFSFNLWPLDFEEFLQTKESEIYNYHQEQKQKFINLILDNKPFELLPHFFEQKLNNYLEEFVTFGGYPKVVLAPDVATKQTILKNIYEAYLTRDIISLLKITNTDTFTKIAAMLSNQIGGLINYQNLSRDSGSYFKELQKFLSILEETYIIKKVSPYFRNSATELKKNPKIYFIDTGLRNSILNNFAKIDERGDKGSLIENFVLSELVKNIEEPNLKLRYWRTTAKTEVDFIIEKGVEPIPLEVKRTNFKKEEIGRSFRSFVKKYQPKIGIIITQNFLSKTKINSTDIYFLPAYFI